MVNVRYAAVGVVFAAASAVVVAASPSAYDTAMRAAMAPYYAALRASARGDLEGTQRHVLLLGARWQEAARLGQTGAPPALVKDPAWPQALDAVTAAVGRARQRVARHDVAGAHGELESIRMTLHAARARQQLLTFDDRFSEFHEAMEHLVGRVPEAHEFRLTDADLIDIRQDLDQVAHHWQTVQASADEVRGVTGWAATAPMMDAAIREAAAAATRGEATAIKTGSDAIQKAYFDLLGTLSSVRARASGHD